MTKSFLSGTVENLSTKVFLLTPRMIHVFQGLEKFLPFNTAERHPHILAKLNLLWPGPEALVYLDGLMVPDREDRTGFDPSVINEILFLRDLHSVIYPATSAISEDVVAKLRGINSLETISGLIGHHNRLEASADVCLKETHKRAKLHQLRPINWGEAESLDELRGFWSQRTAGHTKPLLLGKILVQYKLATPESIDLALELQAMSKTKPKLGRILADANVCSREDIHKALAIQARVPLVDLDLISGAVDALESLSAETAKRLRAYPVMKLGQILFVAVENPLTYTDKSALRFSTTLSIELVYARSSAIEIRLNNLS